MTLATLYHQYKRPLQWLLALIALAFLARVLADSWREVQAYPLAVDARHLILSTVALIITLFVAVLPWQWSVRWLGAALSFQPASRIWFVSNTVRYVPGNIWQPAAMLAMLRARNVDEVRAAASIALNWILSNLSALLLAGVYWTLAPSSISLERAWLLPLILIGALVALHPLVLGRVLRFLVQRTRHTTTFDGWRFDQILRLALLHVVIWFMYGIAFAFFWNAFAPIDLSDVPRLTAAFAAAYAIGFLSLLTPSGLGVREGALVLLLSGSYPAALVTMLALLSRVWLIGGELLCTGIALALARGRDA